MKDGSSAPSRGVACTGRQQVQQADSIDVSLCNLHLHCCLLLAARTRHNNTGGGCRHSEKLTTLKPQNPCRSDLFNRLTCPSMLNRSVCSHSRMYQGTTCRMQTDVLPPPQLLLLLPAAGVLWCPVSLGCTAVSCSTMPPCNCPVPVMKRDTEN